MTIELVITPRERDIGALGVRRLLPVAGRHMVGPFIFFDHMGPADFAAGDGIDVRPHPHIGLSTVTYLFDGEIIHRDSLGTRQAIRPGDVNWMIAGRGITHSERTDEDARRLPRQVHGVQCWVALPRNHENGTPAFFHHPAQTLPDVRLGNARLRVIAGMAYGAHSPVAVTSPLFFAEAHIEAGGTLPLPDGYSERAVYVVSGKVQAGEAVIAPGTMAVFKNNDDAALTAVTDTHAMLLGGEPLSEPRFIDWNFVSSDRARIEQAKKDWQEGNFPKIPGDDKEFVPLPA
jgi:redox-sensitive bicupin YhaK (pirin superfamily)